MKETIMKEPGKVRTKKVEAEIPERLCALLEKVCKVKGVSIDEAIIEGLVNFLGSELETPIGCYLGKEIKSDSPGHYWEYVKSLAQPEEAVQEVKG